MQEIDQKMIELYQEMGRGQGLQDSLLMKLFAILYMEPEPIAMEDLAKKTGYSLASICNKTKMMGPILHIKKIRKPGSKKIFLYMEKDFMRVWKNALMKKEQYVINLAKEKIPPILKEYKSKEKKPIDKKKLKILEDYYSQILKFETVIKKMIKELQKLE